MGNQRLYDIMKEKDALYEKEDFSDEDGIKAAELEAEFAEMDGWEADSNASKLMQGLGLDESIMYSQMADLGGNERLKSFWHRHFSVTPTLSFLTSLQTTLTLSQSLR